RLESVASMNRTSSPAQRDSAIVGSVAARRDRGGHLDRPPEAISFASLSSRARIIAMSLPAPQLSPTQYSENSRSLLIRSMISVSSLVLALVVYVSSAMTHVFRAAAYATRSMDMVLSGLAFSLTYDWASSKQRTRRSIASRDSLWPRLTQATVLA